MKESMTSTSTGMDKNLENDELRQSQRKVFPVASIYACTFLGGPLAGAYILASNFRVLRNKYAEDLTWILTAVFLCFLLGVTVYETVYNLVGISTLPPLTMPSLYSAVYMSVGLWHQRKKVNLFLQRGGRQHSFWRLCLVTLLSLVSTVALIIITYYGIVL